MSEQAGSSAPGPHRHHKPKPFAPIDFEPFAGGADPARVSEAPISPRRRWCAADATAMTP